jgi:two-component system sensor histidine kinase BaeS
MKILHRVRRHLSWKIFLSYLIVVVVGATVLAVTAELSIPQSFQRHLATMVSMMNNMMGGSTTTAELNANLFNNFRDAFNEALLLAALSSVIVAIIVSLLISRRIVTPVQEIMLASQNIAEGNFDDRVNIPGGPDPAQMDELAQLAISFNRMADKLEKTESMRRQLIGDVTHELRTPLSTIKGSMEGLIDGVLPANLETFQKVYRETDRMQRLVQDLQELSRVEAHAFELNRSPVQLEDLINTTRARLDLQYSEKGVDLEVDIPPDLPLITVDEDRIGQVLLNLLGNALQYTPAQGRVTVSAAREGDELIVQIRDTGIGIAREHLPQIFDRFYRVDKSRSRVSGGSGIGLTIAKHLIEAHGGRIWAESPGSGKGSTFTFTLPINSE